MLAAVVVVLAVQAQGSPPRVSGELAFAPALFSTPSDVSFALAVSSAFFDDTLDELRGRVGVLMGAGLAWSAELGAAWRARLFGRWEPDVGAYAATLGGKLIRTIDAHGVLASDPIALELGASPLRFRLDDSWVSFLSLRAGPTLFRGGAPAFMASLSLFEVGTTL